MSNQTNYQKYQSGFFFLGYRVSNGHNADPGEFPWIAALVGNVNIPTQGNHQMHGNWPDLNPNPGPEARTETLCGGCLLRYIIQ